jgi:hypothetical protein
LAPPCKASVLDVRAGVQGATGTIVYAIALRNSGTAACSLLGRPTVNLTGKNAEMVGWQTKPLAWNQPAVLRNRLRALRPNETALLTLLWANWCGPSSQPASGPGPAPDAIVITLPHEGGTISVPIALAPRCDEPSAPSTLRVSSFAFEQPQPSPSTRVPLAARILGQISWTSAKKPRLRSVARRGHWLRYRVALTNVARHPFRFRSCPPYIEDVGGHAQTYVLNCRPMGTLAPRATAVFAMAAYVPATARFGVNGLSWELAPQSYLPPFTATAVIVARR